LLDISTNLRDSKVKIASLFIDKGWVLLVETLEILHLCTLIEQSLQNCMAVPTSRKIKVAFFADILVKDFDGASRTMFQIIERIPNDRFEFMFFCGMEPTHEFPYQVFKVPAVRIPGNSTIPTEQIVKELEGYGFDSGNMKIWQRGINNGLFSPAKKDSGYLKGVTGNDKPNVIFASRLVWEKNLATLIKIYRKSKEDGDKYNFIIVGDGVASEKLKDKMPDAFHLGKVDHVTLAKLYASSDVFLFTSISETYGNVVVEAMASGCPCVIARGGGSQSLVSHGKTGFLCKPNDASDYLQRIDQLVTDSELRSTIIANGIEYTKPLNWESLAETYFDDITYLAETASTKSLVS